MVLRKASLCCLILVFTVQLSAQAQDTNSPDAATTLFVYPSNHGFLHQTGYHVPYGWSAMYRIHPPGYFIEGQISGGDVLPAGTYRYVFPFTLLPGQLGGLLSGADDVVRIEAWDATTHERLMNRTFQVSDFLPLGHHYTKAITFSTVGRAGHHFEPRIYWPGLSGVFLRRVILQRLQDFSAQDLADKADVFEKAMGALYLDRGYVVSRQLNGKPSDVGDAAIWTGLYAASEAWRFKATHSPDALENMQNSLQALHQLYVQAPVKGTLVRYIYPDGRLYPDAASKDTYTGFFFAAAQCLPFVKDKILRQDLRDDVDGLAAHFLDHDLAFVPKPGEAVEFRSSFSKENMAEALEDLRHDAGQRRHVLQILKAVHFYFLVHAQQPWPGLQKMIRALKREDFSTIRRDMVPFLNGALQALHQLQRNVHRSAVLWRWQDAPYQKLDRLLLQTLQQLTDPARPIQQPDDLKILSSQSLHALHFLKAAATILPKPNRYADYYTQNLWQNQALLKAALQWDNMDEDLIEAVTGASQAAALRTNSSHLSFLALFDLITLEKDPVLRKDYQALFARQFLPVQADYNAMLEVMQPIAGMSPGQTGLAFWSLELYPEDRQGKGESYWRDHHRALAARYGGEISGQARDPLPLNERQRDPFIWQRSARSLRGDDANQSYPPLDYLFVYWLARANGQIRQQ